MNEKIVEMLHLSLEPVGIFLGNTSAISELEASPQKRNCVIPFVLAAAKGKITSLDEDGCTCTISSRYLVRICSGPVFSGRPRTRYASDSVKVIPPVTPNHTVNSI